MRCLVLGGLGFIGSRLVDALLSEGHFVRCFDRPHVMAAARPPEQNPNFEFYEGDFASESSVKQALDGCDICFHLVSTTLPETSNADPAFDVESNVLSTVRMLTQAVEGGLKKVIFISSGGTVYGLPQTIPVTEDHPTDPICSYGIAKLAIEKYLSLFHKLHGLDYVVLRLANPFGEHQRTRASQGAIAVFLGRALRGETIEIWGDGSVVRDYVHIDDVVSALLLAMVSQPKNRVLNIGSGAGQSINNILDIIETVLGKKIKRNYLPGRPFDVPVNVLCIEKARAQLGWAPEIQIADGIRRVATALQNPSA